MLYTYQQVLHLIENDEAYKQKEPTGKKRGKRERKTDREKERKKERKKESDKSQRKNVQTLNSDFQEHFTYLPTMLQLIEKRGL